MGRVSIGSQTVEVPDEVEKKMLDLHKEIRELPERVTLKVVQKIRRDVMRQFEYAEDMRHVRRRLLQYFDSDVLKAIKE